MPLVLFDKNIPRGIRPHLVGHTVRTTEDEGWPGLENGDLLFAAEQAGFEIVLTADRRIRYQQNLAGRKMAIVVLDQQQWPKLRPHVQLVVDAVNSATAGSYIEVKIPR